MIRNNQELRKQYFNMTSVQLIHVLKGVRPSVTSV